MAHSNGAPLVKFTDPSTRANKAMEKLAGAQEDAFRKVAKNRDLVERSIEVSRGITYFYPNGVRSEKDVREILAAKAVGLMQSLPPEEREAFLRATSGRIISIMEAENMAELFIEKSLDPQTTEDRRIDVIAGICNYNKLAEDNFDMFRYLCLQDAMEKDENEYEEMYAQPIINGDIPPAVIYARLVDAAIDPEKKIMNVGKDGRPYYDDAQMMEVLKTMMTVYYPLSDAMGFGTTLAVNIRRNATVMLENLLKRKAEWGKHDASDIETLMLYERCKEYFEYLENEARELAKTFIRGGVLQEIIDSMGERFRLKIALASHTCDPEDVDRLKGPSGMFWKVRKYRKKGDLKYDIHRLKDILATTMVVEGTLEDAKAVANRLVWHLRQRLRATDINIKSIPRETGYEVPHVTCKVKFGEKEVPFEIQVRPAEAHEEAKTGALSHAAKISGFITWKLIEVLRSTFEEMESANDTQRLSRAALNLGERSEKIRYQVRVFEEKHKLISKYKDVFAARGECVGGVVAIAWGFSRGAVEVEDASGKGLDLFEPCPDQITITLKGGKGINKETCKMLMDGKVLTPEALAIISAYCKSAHTRKGIARK